MDSLYSRYANALLSIALDENDVEGYRNEVKIIKKEFVQNEEILHLLSSYFLEDSEKEDIIDKIYDGNDNIKNFIKIIVKNKRTNYIVKIFDEFVKDCNEVLNIKDGIVYSVKPLSEDEIERIEKGLENKLSSQVELENIIDERLIGGVKVIVEDKIFDGSIKNKVERLKESLIGGN